MKRVTRRLCALLTVFCLIAGLAAGAAPAYKAQAASTTQKVRPKQVKALYKSFLENLEEEHAGNPDFADAFLLLNIDRSGVAELIVKNYYVKEPKTGTFTVYTVKDGVVTEIGRYSQSMRDGANGKISYSKKYKALYYRWWQNGFGYNYHLYGITGGELKSIRYAAKGQDFRTLKTLYYTGTVGGSTAKQVSKSAFTSFFNKYFASSTRKTYSLAKNTAKNRKKRLG